MYSLYGQYTVYLMIYTNYYKLLFLCKCTNVSEAAASRIPWYKWWFIISRSNWLKLFPLHRKASNHVDIFIPVTMVTQLLQWWWNVKRTLYPYTRCLHLTKTRRPWKICVKKNWFCVVNITVNRHIIKQHYECDFIGFSRYLEASFFKYCNNLHNRAVLHLLHVSAALR